MLIQSILFFILGISVIAFVLVLISPLIWRRMLFLAKRHLRANPKQFNKESSVKENFLKAQHAVALAQAQERCQILETLSDQQKIKIDSNKEQLEKLSRLENETKHMAERIAYYENLISDSHKVMQDLREEQLKNNQNVQNCLMSEKSIRINIASYEDKMHDLKNKINSLMNTDKDPKSNNLESSLTEPKEQTPKPSTYQRQLHNLHQELKEFAEDFISELKDDKKANLSS